MKATDFSLKRVQRKIKTGNVKRELGVFRKEMGEKIKTL